MKAQMTPPPEPSPVPIIGLVGGIGSGKSLVARAFARHGGVVIPADELGHEALRDPAIKSAIIARWGRDVLDDQGDVVRRKLGKVVFADPEELTALEGLVFPFIGRRINEEIAQVRTRPDVKLIVLDAAIMLETGWADICDHVVFVDAPREQRLARLKSRNGWSEPEVEQREKSQMPLAEKRRRADAVVENSTTPEAVAWQVEKLLIQWRPGRPGG